MGNTDFSSALPEEGTRLLPIYLLLDTSGSMVGAGIQSLREGLEQFKNEVANEGYWADLVRIGIITFASEARPQGGGLVPIGDFQMPDLQALGVTRLDLAFQKVLESVDRDVRRPIKGGQRGDYKPMVIVLTDGVPTDAAGQPNTAAWVAARKALLDRPKGTVKPSSILAVGCGEDVDEGTLLAISTGKAFKMGKSVQAFVQLFQLLTISIGASIAAGGVITDPFDDLPPDSELMMIQP